MGRRGTRPGRALPRRAAGRGARLVGRARAELNATERDFVAASRAASQRSQRRLRATLAGLAALLALAVVAGAVALEQRGHARAEATAAEAQRLGARALVEDDLDLSLLLARQGVALDDSPADAREPAGRAAQEPGRDRRAARRRRPPARARPQPGRAHAGVRRQRRHGAASSTGARAARRDRRPRSPGSSASSTHDQARRPAVQPRRLTARRRRRSAGRPGRAHPPRARPPAVESRSVHLRAALRARRAHAARRGRVPARSSRRPSSASTRAPAQPVGAGRRCSSGLVALMVTGDGRRVVTTGVDGTRRSTTPARCARCGAGPCERNRRR